jgi:hypothetical protein
MLAQKLMGATSDPDALDISWIGASSQDGSQTSAAFNFTGVSIGAADADRVVLLGMRTFNGSGTLGALSSVTIGGVTATQLAYSQGGNSGVGIFAAAIPSGTTSTISISTGNRTSCGIGIWRMVKAGASLATYDATATAASSFSIGTIANGAVIAVAGVANGLPISWSALTERSEIDIRSDEWTAWADEILSPSTTTITNTFNFNFSLRYAAVSFAP